MSEDIVSVCPACGHEVKSNGMICMYCGHNINGSVNANDSIKDLKEKEAGYEQSRSNADTSIRSLGVMLMIIGGACDLISMFLVGGGSYESFSFFTIGGTICFMIGIFLAFIGNH